MSGGGNLGAIGSGVEFRGFETADFEAYLPKKRRSNAFTLQRRQAKDRLLALTRSARADLEDGLSALEFGASDEAPSVANARSVDAQWVFFTRPAEMRQSLKPFLHRTDLQSGASLFDIAVNHQHICLQLRLSDDGLAVGIEMATKAVVDRDNAAAKLKHSWARKQFLELMASLPSETRIGFADDLESALELKDVPESWAALWGESQDTFRAEVHIDQSDEVLTEPALIGTVSELLVAFLPLYEFFAWTRDNDKCDLQVSIQQKKKAKKEATVSALSPGARVTILAGLLSGRAGYIAEVEKDKVKVMVGPVAMTVDVKDVKPA